MGLVYMYLVFSHRIGWTSESESFGACTHHLLQEIKCQLQLLFRNSCVMSL